MRKKTKKFQKVYFVVQTAPIFAKCGHTFSKTMAKYIADQVHAITGQPGQIVEFTREELQRLNYGKSPNPKR